MLLKVIHIKSSQIDSLKNFYESILELPVIPEGKSSIHIIMGVSTLVIEEATEGNPFYHFAINIPSNKIEEARLWLLNKNIALLWMDDYNSDVADFSGWHAKSVYFFDPGGNIVELIARFDLATDRKEIFSSGQFLSISEIGLVFPEVTIDEEVERIMKQCQLPYFLKQPPMQQFKVLGDDEGLFIIVTDNRNWYPTNKPSGIFPLAITFENNGKIELLRY